MTTQETYRKLEKIFGRFNEAIVTLFSDLIDLVPTHQKPALMAAMKETLENTTGMHRMICGILFMQPVDRK